MMTKRLFVTTAAILALSVSLGAQSDWKSCFSFKKGSADKAELTELTWDDLIPDDFVQPENPFISMSQEEIDKLMDGSDESEAEIARLQAEFNYAPVVEGLDGKRVKIPAYITPLEFDGQTEMSEFLLVPYIGACMHTPPPPANQVVHAESPVAVKNPGMYEAIWAVGTIHAETVQTNLAETGYRLEVEKVMPYEKN